MEESFDWQNWQQNLRGFAMASGTGAPGFLPGLWGSEI